MKAVVLGLVLVCVAAGKLHKDFPFFRAIASESGEILGSFSYCLISINIRPQTRESPPTNLFSCNIIAFSSP